jgi:WD40 repeat protein
VDVVWSADGERLLAVVEGPASTVIDRVQVWDVATGQRVHSIMVQRTATAWAMNEQYLAVATQAAQQQGTARLSTLLGAPISPTLSLTPTPGATPTPPPTPAPPAPSPSAREVIEVWELTTGSLVAVLDPEVPAAHGAIQTMVWAPDSSKLAAFISPFGAAPPRRAWHIWDAPAGKALQTIGIPPQEYAVLAWSRDGQSLALGTGVYALETGRRSASYTAKGYLYAQAWAPDGRRFAVWERTGVGLYATKYDVISIIEASSGRQIALYDGGVSDTSVGPVDGQSRMAWSPDGHHLLVVRRAVEVWRLGPG